MVHPNYRYYQFLAFNSGFGNSKKAIFKKLGYIELHNGMYDTNIEDVADISEISKDALKELRNFIIEQRQQDPTFCKTIFDAVVEVVGLPQQQ